MSILTWPAAPYRLSKQPPTRPASADAHDTVTATLHFDHPIFIDQGGYMSYMGKPRRIRVKGMAGVDAAVVVTVVRDTVWLSISPPLTWEAIMEPRKVDEVISLLEQARDEAKKVATARNGSA
jgi:hypothetical protein